MVISKGCGKGEGLWPEERTSSDKDHPCTEPSSCCGDLDRARHTTQSQPPEALEEKGQPPPALWKIAEGSYLVQAPHPCFGWELCVKSSRQEDRLRACLG